MARPCSDGWSPSLFVLSCSCIYQGSYFNWCSLINRHINWCIMIEYYNPNFVNNLWSKYVIGLFDFWFFYCCCGSFCIQFFHSSRRVLLRASFNSSDTILKNVVPIISRLRIDISQSDYYEAVGQSCEGQMKVWSSSHALSQCMHCCNPFSARTGT